MKNRKWDSSFRQLQLHSPLQWQFFITLPYSICYEETAVWSSWPNWALSEEEMSCFWCVHRVPLCSFESLPHSGLLRGPWARGSRVHPTHKHGPGVRKSLKRILKQKIPLEIWMGKNKTRGEKGGGAWVLSCYCWVFIPGVKRRSRGQSGWGCVNWEGLKGSNGWDSQRKLDKAWGSLRG